MGKEKVPSQRQETTAGFSPRLESLLLEVIRGQAPNAGRFCGYCYMPLPKERSVCPHCGHDVDRWPTTDRVPHEVIAMFRAKMQREGLVVRVTFYTVLALGVLLSALAISFFSFWWRILVFLLGLGLTYILSANIANIVGEVVGYTWGQRILTRRWQEFVERRGRAESWR